ncbi:nuclease [Methylobacterium sp. NEAU 140]|uniref:nuclease n=1 Tax=Methylobacterium sp. NEAU 140 TaxID=3064945 RepID=UPI0027365275|nr:nuclease [Methylobacterium sp. NEAU 140]MDP4026716.1 nuclease [Methylobacterium sp. NEAU 140]
MTASTAVAEPGAEEGTRPALDAPGRAPLRETIRSELALARPRPVAARTLELMALAALEPDAAPPGYRVVDRRGAPRLRATEAGADGQGTQAGDAAPRPMTLADLVAELRAGHPALFLPPEPEPEPEPAPAQARDASLLAGASEMRAATARFVEAQSGRARSLAERSSNQGRALAQSAAGALAALRARVGRPAAPAEGAASPAGTATESVDPAAAWNSGAGRFGDAVSERLRTLRDRFGGPEDDPAVRRRRWFAGVGAAALTAIVAAGLVTLLRTPSPQAPSSTAAPTQTARAPAIPDTVTPPPESDGRGDPEPEATPPPANAVTGPVQVVDTATLKVGGRVVRLFGVEWVRGGQAQELARYIAGRPVVCQPAPGSETMNCAVDGRDLSEVVLYNGGGRASPEASPELVAAEDHARSERLGVWKR